jgi:hypothetical protein
MPPDKARGRPPQSGPGTNQQTTGTAIVPSVAGAAGVTAAELVALARGETPCACCTTNPTRRAALDRLHDQDQRRRIARLHDLAPLTTYYRSRRGRAA